MKVVRSTSHRMVLVTVPDLGVARALASAVLESRTAACVSLVPGVESHYWWKGRIEQSAELQLVMKTTARRVSRLAAVVRAHHPYETPEFVVLPITAGSASYLRWIGENVSESGPGPG